jgi:hypothetical protein
MAHVPDDLVDGRVELVRIAMASSTTPKLAPM